MRKLIHTVRKSSYVNLSNQLVYTYTKTETMYCDAWWCELTESNDTNRSSRACPWTICRVHSGWFAPKSGFWLRKKDPSYVEPGCKPAGGRRRRVSLVLARRRQARRRWYTMWMGKQMSLTWLYSPLIRIPRAIWWSWTTTTQALSRRSPLEITKVVDITVFNIALVSYSRQC